MGYLLKDALLKLTLAGPVNNQTVTSTSLDLGEITSHADFLAQAEALLTTPGLSTSQLADAHTVSWDIIDSPNADLSSPRVLSSGIVVQTGAGGVGAATATARYRPPTNVQRYLGFRANGVAGGGDSSGASGTLELVF